MLFGVYHFIERHSDVRWFHLEPEAPRPASFRSLPGRTVTASASIPRRMLIVQDDPGEIADLRLIVDWLAKNRMNALCLGFDSWRRNRRALLPEARKRGLEIAVGGHGFKRFLSPGFLKTHPECASLIRGKRSSAHAQFCLAHPLARRCYVDRVCAYAARNPGLSTLSLWPDDEPGVCECPECSRRGFLDSYVSLIEEASAALRQKGLSIQLEHVAYNAGGNRRMMQYPGRSSPARNRTLFAYWGRNYAFPWHASPEPHDREAWSDFLVWTRRAGDSLTAVEYYNDYYMQTSLLMPLTRVIAADMKRYASLGIHGVADLLVPPRLNRPERRRLDWRWESWLNLYFFARFAFSPHLRHRDVLNDYVRNYYGPHDRIARAIRRMERSLAGISKFNWNVDREWPYQFHDTWGSADLTRKIDWLKQDYHPNQSRRLRFCRRILRTLPSGQPFSRVGPAGAPDRRRRFLFYLERSRRRARSLLLQMQAQRDITRRRYRSALARIIRASALERRLFKEDSDYLDIWRSRIRRLIAAKED